MNHLAESYIGFERLLRIFNTFIMRMGTEDEQAISDNFLDIIAYLGDVVPCDEKLFRFTGDSGFVRLCPNKPAKMGIWSYQACVFLGNGLVFLIFTKAHLAPSALGMKVQTHSVVREWANIVRKFKSDAVLVMDSYYLSKEGRSALNDEEEKVNYIAALKADRFKLINAFLASKVSKSGDTAVAWNDERGEAAVYHWSLDKNVGKKLVMSNAFVCKSGKRTPAGAIPIYDHYNNGFSGCDKFNSGLHGKTYPYVTRRSRAGSDMHCGWNYLLSCVLLNTYNAYLYLNDLNMSQASFNDVCAALARDLCK